jgi:hypothetical protein
VNTALSVMHISTHSVPVIGNEHLGANLVASLFVCSIVTMTL